MDKQGLIDFLKEKYNEHSGNQIQISMGYEKGKLAAFDGEDIVEKKDTVKKMIMKKDIKSVGISVYDDFDVSKLKSTKDIPVKERYEAKILGDKVNLEQVE